jgi:hypothetical protein
VKRPRLAGLPVLLLILAAAFFCYGGPGIRALGFYHDDWILWSYLHFAPAGFRPGMAALARQNGSLLLRPLGIPLYSGLYRLFGLDPLPWQATLLLVNALAAFAVYRLLLRYRAPERLAALGAILFLAWPSKDATMFWPCVMINSLSLLAWLTAYSFQLDYIETGKTRRLAAALALLAASLALYDQTLFVLPLWLVSPGLTARGPSRRAMRGTAAASVVTALYLGYKMILVPRVLGVPFNKTVVLSVRHFAFTYVAGLNAAFGPKLILFCLATLRDAAAAHPLVVAAALACPWLALTLRASPGNPERPDLRPLIFFGAGLFALGYLPIAVSDYLPTPLNQMNRINQVPQLGLILAALGLGLRLAPRRRLQLAAGALASLLVAVHVGLAGDWAESYRRQNEIRAMLLTDLDRWPAGKTLLLLQRERYVKDKVPVFDAHYDITGAARIWTGDPGRTADVVSPRMDFLPGGVVTAWGKRPYADVVLLDVPSRRLIPSTSYRDYHWRAPRP